jgi:hypothetical protein
MADDPKTGTPALEDGVRDRPDQADHHKHMDYVQSVIARLGNDSFLMKGWALTVSTAVLAYALAHLDWRVALFAFLPGVLFWYLDSYFLHREKLFRLLFDDVAAGKVRNFSMTYENYLPQVSRRKVFFSETLRWFYGLILAVATVVFIGALCASPNKQPVDRQELRPSPAGSTSP